MAASSPSRFLWSAAILAASRRSKSCGRDARAPFFPEHHKGAPLPGFVRPLTASATLGPTPGVECPAFRAGDVHDAREKVSQKSAAAEDGQDRDDFGQR